MKNFNRFRVVHALSPWLPSLIVVAGLATGSALADEHDHDHERRDPRAGQRQGPSQGPSPAQPQGHPQPAQQPAQRQQPQAQPAQPHGWGAAPGDHRNQQPQQAQPPQPPQGQQHGWGAAPGDHHGRQPEPQDHARPQPEPMHPGRPMPPPRGPERPAPGPRHEPARPPGPPMHVERGRPMPAPAPRFEPARPAPAPMHFGRPLAPSRPIYVEVAPPRMRHEVPPPRPSPGHVWIDGYWGWQNGAHIWIEGEWATPPQPGYVWEAPRWRRHGRRWEYAPGYWRHHHGPIYVAPEAPGPAYGGGVTISGRVMSMQGAPVPGIMVTLAGSQEGRIVTDGSGGFVFAGLPPGSYAIRPTGDCAFAPDVANFNDLYGSVTQDIIVSGCGGW